MLKSLACLPFQKPLTLLIPTQSLARLPVAFQTLLPKALPKILLANLPSMANLEDIGPALGQPILGMVLPDALVNPAVDMSILLDVNLTR